MKRSFVIDPFLYNGVTEAKIREQICISYEHHGDAHDSEIPWIEQPRNEDRYYEADYLNRDPQKGVPVKLHPCIRFSGPVPAFSDGLRGGCCHFGWGQGPDSGCEPFCCSLSSTMFISSLVMFSRVNLARKSSTRFAGTSLPRYFAMASFMADATSR